MKNAKGIIIGMVAYNKVSNQFWKVVGWCGANSLALQQVKPYGRKFRSMGPNIAVKTNDWYWDNCEVVSYKEIEVIIEHTRRQSRTANSTVQKRKRRVQTYDNKTRP